MSEFKLLVIDGHSLAFRAFYAMDPQNFQTESGLYTNAIYGFTSMIVKMLKNERPTHVAVAFDLSRHSFRTDIYPEYKAGRQKTPPEFNGQIEQIQKVVESMGIRWFTQENVEADDILATLSTQGVSQGMEVLIFSGDRDTFQLINDHVTVLYPRWRITDMKRMTPQAVQEKYDVPPNRYRQLAALTGEKADNLPGVPLIGEKTAAQLLNKFDGIENLLENAHQVKGKRGQNLVSHIENVKRNLELNRLRTDIALSCTMSDLKWQGVDPEAINTLFDQLSFKRLRSEVISLNKLFENPRSTTTKESGQSSSNKKASSKATHQETTLSETEHPEELLSEETLANIVTLSSISDKEFAAFWQNQVRENTKEIWALSFLGNLSVNSARLDAVGAFNGNTALVFRTTQLNAKQEKLFAQFLADKTKTKIVFDEKSLIHAMRAQGLDLEGVDTDVLLADYVCDPDAARTNIEQLTERLLGYQLFDLLENTEHKIQQLELDLGIDPDGKQIDANEQADAQDPYLIVPWEEAKVLAQTAQAIYMMAPVIKQRLELRQVKHIYEDIERPLVSVLAKMEQTGIAVDNNTLSTLGKELENQVAFAQNQAFEAIGRTVNLSSPKQLQEILFEQLKMPPTRKTKRGYTTNAKALEELSIYHPHPFLDALLEHRDRIKLLQIVKTLQDKIQDDGRIHTTFGQTVAATGRLSSIEPNLQNIPARTSEGLKIRESFVVGQGFESLLTADYSQIEMRLMAHLSGDKTLIQAFESGEDLHRSVAALVYGISAQDVSAKQRSHIKATSYGLAYGLSAFGLAGQLKISQAEAKYLMETYFRRFGTVRDYLEEVVEKARYDGFTQTIDARRRYIPGLRSENHRVRENARRAALNAPIQGSAADLIKKAMLAVQRNLESENLSSRMLLQVHDELILEVAPGEENQVRKLVSDSMTQVVSLTVPLEVSIGVGANWKAAAH